MLINCITIGLCGQRFIEGLELDAAIDLGFDGLRQHGGVDVIVLVVVRCWFCHVMRDEM